MSFGGGNQTVTTKSDLTQQQKDLVNLAMPFAKQYASGETSGSQIANNPVVGMNATQTAGQQQVLGAVPQQQQLANSAGGASNRLLSGEMLSPDSNPALAQTIKAATDPIYQNLTSSVMPQIRSGATAAGQYGSSRQGIAEGIAARGADQAAASAAAPIANQAYQSGVDAMTKALGLAPQTTQLQAQPGVTTAGVGDVQQAQAQNTATGALQQQLYNAMLPYQVASNLGGLALGIPGGGNTTTQPSNTNLLGSALGGVGLGTALGPALGFSAGQGALGGAGLGALLAFL